MMFKKSKTNGVKIKQEHGKADPFALGNLLMSSGAISLDQLKVALQKQREEHDERLGYILLQEGFIDEETLELYIRKQQVLKSNFRSEEVRKYIEIARRRSHSASDAHNELANAALSLTTKLKG